LTWRVRRSTSTIVASDNSPAVRYDGRGLPSFRHHSTTGLPRDHAHEVSIAPKSVELEQRLARVELQQQRITETLDLILKRLTAIQAQLDHVGAKLGWLS